jgi:hypothetical protein
MDIKNERINNFLNKVRFIEERGLYPIGVIGIRKIDTFIGRIIKFFQNDPYHHVEFLLSDNKTTLASRNGIGVDFYSVEDKYVKDKYDIFNFDEQFNEEKKKLFYIYLKTLLIYELNYDYISVFSVIFNNIIKYSNGSYCSEIIYDITKFCKYPLVNNNHKIFNNIIYPSDICKSIRLINIKYRVNNNES